MKAFILATLFVGSAQAQVYFKTVPICTSWRFSDGGYVCSGYPTSESIPDQFSLNNKMVNLENRIQALENKIAQLEQEKKEKGQ